MAGNLVINALLNTTGLTRGLTKTARSLNNFGANNSLSKGKLKKGSGGLGMYSGMGRGMGLASKGVLALSSSLAGATTYAVGLAAATEQTRISFEVLAGNKDIGQALFAEMEKMAQNTALTIGETTQAAKQLLLSFDAANIPRLVKMLGNISSGMDNVSLQEMAFLLQTSAEEGKLLARDLRQFTTRGINMTGALADTFGFEGPDAKQKVTEMVTAGHVGINDVMKALEKLGSNDMLERQANTFTGAFNQAKDAITLTIRDFGELFMKATNLTQVIKNIKSTVIGWRESLQANRPVIEGLIGAIMAFGGAAWDVFKNIMGFAKAAFMYVAEFFGFKQGSMIEDIVMLSAAAEFFFDNWQSYMTLAVLNAQSSFTKFYRDLKYAFTTKLPAYLDWFLENWKLVLVSVGQYAATAFTNLYINISNLSVALKDMLKGGKFEFDYTNITEGFDKITKQLTDTMPVIAPRVLEPDEILVNQTIAELGTELQDGMGEAMIKARDEYRAFKVPEVPQLGPETDIVFPDQKGRGKAQTDQKLGMMQRGSAEAIQTVIKAMGGSAGKSPEFIELSRQTHILKIMSERLKKEEFILRAQGAIP